VKLEYLQIDRTRIDEHIREILPKVLSIPPAEFSEVLTTVNQEISNFLFRKSKRIRATLGIMGFKATTSSLRINSLPYLSSSLELLHAFLLVHDDIVDNSELRRGLPTMHKLFEMKWQRKAKKPKRLGESYAIFIGDIFFTAALRSIHLMPESDEIKNLLTTIMLQYTQNTLYADIVDIAHSAKRIEDVSIEKAGLLGRWKTSFYSFELPLVMGAILGNADDEQIDSLQKFGKYLGQAFQLNDDLLGIFGNSAKMGKPNTVDIEEGKKTIPLILGYDKLNPADKEFFNKFVGTSNLSPVVHQKLRDMLKKTGCIDESEKIIHELTEKACDSLNKKLFVAKYYYALNEFAQKLSTRLN